MNFRLPSEKQQHQSVEEANLYAIESSQNQGVQEMMKYAIATLALTAVQART
jgi:hypothetical protein